MVKSRLAIFSWKNRLGSSIVPVLAHENQAAPNSAELPQRRDGRARLGTVLQTQGRSVLLGLDPLPAGAAARVVRIAAVTSHRVPTPGAAGVGVYLDRPIGIDAPQGFQRARHGLRRGPVDELHVVPAPGVDPRIGRGEVLGLLGHEEDRALRAVVGREAEGDGNRPASLHLVGDVELPPDPGRVEPRVGCARGRAVDEHLHRALAQRRQRQVDPPRPVSPGCERLPHPERLVAARQSEDQGLARVVQADPAGIVVAHERPAPREGLLLVVALEPPWAAQVLGAVGPAIEKPPVGQGDVGPRAVRAGPAGVTPRDLVERQFADLLQEADELPPVQRAVEPPEHLVEGPDLAVGIQ